MSNNSLFLIPQIETLLDLVTTNWVVAYLKEMGGPQKSDLARVVSIEQTVVNAHQYTS